MALRVFGFMLLIAAMWPISGLADIFLHQPHDFRDRSPSEQNTLVSSARTADDFATVGFHFFLNSITFQMVVSANNIPSNYAVDLFLSSAQGPGQLMFTLDHVLGMSDRGVWNGDPELRLIEVVVDGRGEHTPEGVYWLSPYAIGNGAGRAWWGTAGDGQVNGSEGYFISDHFGVPQWTPISQSGILNFPTDFAFTIDATFPAPGVLPLLVLGLLGKNRRRVETRFHRASQRA